MFTYINHLCIEHFFWIILFKSDLIDTVYIYIYIYKLGCLESNYALSVSIKNVRWIYLNINIKM